VSGGGLKNKKKEMYLLDLQSSTDKSSQQRNTTRHCRTPMKSNIVGIGCNILVVTSWTARKERLFVEGL